MCIAQELVELVERLGNIGIAHPVDNVDHFPGLAVRHLDLVLFPIFGERIAIIRQKSNAGQRYIQESVSEGVEPRMPVRPDIASASYRTGNADQSEKDEDRELSRGSHGAKRKWTKGQIGRSPDLEFAKQAVSLARAELEFPPQRRTREAGN